MKISEKAAAAQIRHQQDRRAGIRGRLSGLQVEERSIVSDLRQAMAEREAQEAKGGPVSDRFAEFRP